MKAAKTIFAVAVTILLLLLGAMLPKLVGAVQNRASAQPGFGDIQAVELTLKEPLSLLEKIHITGTGLFYPFTGETCLTEETLREAVETGLGPYYYRELVPYNWKTTTFEAEPYLLYQSDSPERNFPIWMVVQSCGDWTLSVYVDDESGKIIYIQFNSKTGQDIYTAEDYTLRFRDAWFESLDLSEVGWYDLYMGTNGNTTSLRSYYFDETFGAMTLEFTTFPQGFWSFVLE